MMLPTPELRVALSTDGVIANDERSRFKKEPMILDRVPGA